MAKVIRNAQCQLIWTP